MNTKTILALTLGAGAGAIIGVATDRLIFRTRKVLGTLNIDKSNPEKELYSIDFDNLDDISNKKRVILKVETINE